MRSWHSMGEKFGGIRLCKKSQWFQGSPVLLNHVWFFYCPMFTFLHFGFCLIYIISPLHPYYSPLLSVSKDDSSCRHASATGTLCGSNSPQSYNIITALIPSEFNTRQITKSWCLPVKYLCLLRSSKFSFFCK